MTKRASGRASAPARERVAGGQADRSAQAGVVLAFAGHLLLLGLLSLAWGQQQPRAWPEPTPIEVSLVTEVAPQAQAPPAAQPPAPSVAPETGEPADAPPPPPAPTPAKPTPPEPTPPQPAPAKPTPAKPTPPKPAPPKAAPAKPAPPRPVAVKPVPAPKPAPVRPAPVRPAPRAPATATKTPSTASSRSAPTSSAPTRPSAAPPRSSRLNGLLPSTAPGTTPAATTARPRGARLGDNFLAGLSADAPERRQSPAAPAARPAPYPTASIVQAIARQIQPCADRQVNPGPGANRILTTLNIRLHADGSLAATPSKVKQSGVDDENDRYAQRVVDLGIAAFKGCSPLKLPGEYYQTANGGWGNINYQWKLR